MACELDIPSHPRIVQISEKEAVESQPFIFSTACWRHYVGSWEIKNGQLYLVGIVGIYKLNGDDPLFADWYSGTLRVPIGDMCEYVHMGYASVYERELFIVIQKGIVVSQYEKTFR